MQWLHSVSAPALTSPWPTTTAPTAGAAACGLLVSATVYPLTSSQFANMPLTWLACSTQMSQWREINLRARRCQAGNSCGLQFHQMSAVANLQQTWTGHRLHVLYTHSKYFHEPQNSFVTAHMARVFRAIICKIWRNVLMRGSMCFTKVNHSWNRDRQWVCADFMLSVLIRWS